MARESARLLLAVFPEENAAELALDQLRQAQKSRIVAVEAAAVVRRGADGELQITETTDPGGRRGAVAGAMIGAVIGLLGGPGGAIVAGAAGALVGGITAQVIDSGIPDQNLESIGQSLLPGDSAVVVIVDEPWQEQSERVLAAAGARVFAGTLTSIIAEQLELPDSPPGDDRPIPD